MPFEAADSVLIGGRQYDAGERIPDDAPTDLPALVQRGLAREVKAERPVSKGRGAASK